MQSINLPRSITKIIFLFRKLYSILCPKIVSNFANSASYSFSRNHGVYCICHNFVLENIAELNIKFSSSCLVGKLRCARDEFKTGQRAVLGLHIHTGSRLEDLISISLKPNIRPDGSCIKLTFRKNCPLFRIRQNK